MSEYAEAPGWWQASDGKWYPPELHPSVAQAPAPPLPQPAFAPANVTKPAPTVTPKVITLIAAAATILGALLPWATITAFVTVSKNGIEGDGVITLILGIVLALLAYFQWRPVLQLVAAALITAVAVFDVVDVSTAGEDGIGPSVGIGLWMTLVAGVAALVGTIQELRQRAPG